MKKTILTILVLNLIYSCGGSDSPEPTPTPTPVENKAPTAYGTVNLDNGKANETTFIFNANQSTDPENKPMTYEVDVDGDGTYDTQSVSTNTNTNYKYTSAVNANPKIKVKDSEGLTSVYSIPTKVGVWATDADKPQVSISSQNYVIVGSPMTVGANVVEPNGLPTENDLFYGSLNKGNIGNSATITPTTDMIGSDLELRVRAETPYHIEGESTKTTKVGSEIPYNWILTDKADGKEYFAGVNDGVIWLRQNYAGSLGEYYDNNPENELFGKYLTAAEVDKLEDVVMIDGNGKEFQTHVASEAEWNNSINAYGGEGIGGGPLKYKEFSNGENVGATNDSGMSLMLGGAYSNNLGFVELGDRGYYMTSTNNETGSKKLGFITKDNKNVGVLNGSAEDIRAPTRLIIEN